ncbi:hypothetical protein P4056_02970 [Pseudomonas aeruginosa]|nr:hypothetical protein [Pseudomonas aeruginosa]
MLGEGWSLAGLSSIERCPASIAQDGQNRQVGLLESDRLCLDGMRLQLLSGEYFAGQRLSYRDRQLLPSPGHRQRRLARFRKYALGTVGS